MPLYLTQRAKIIRQIRRYFNSHDYTEVETPILIDSPAPEPHIDCPPCEGGFLRASPELQMKKLLAYGMDRIYQIGPCFRAGETGSRHNPEFTMLEWYRKDATYLDILDDMRNIYRKVSRERPRIIVMKVRDAYRKYAKWDPWEKWDGERFDYDMATLIEPAIGKMNCAVFLVDYPIQAASLAKVTDDYAERWEFYINGMEIGNCFTELCDGVEQRKRFMAAREDRRKLGELDYPIDEEFLNVLGEIKSAAGVAIGIDRLVMSLTGAKRISDVRVI